MSAFIRPLKIHEEYGVKDIPGVRVLSIEESPRADKKYMMVVSYRGNEHTVHFGNPEYQHYHDRAPGAIWSDHDHNDPDRRRNYLARATAIRNKQGKLTVNDPFSPNRYAVIVLW